jgi:hypothetical protein
MENKTCTHLPNEFMSTFSPEARAAVIVLINLFEQNLPTAEIVVVWGLRKMQSSADFIDAVSDEASLNIVVQQ